MQNYLYIYWKSFRTVLLFHDRNDSSVQILFLMHMHLLCINCFIVCSLFGRYQLYIYIDYPINIFDLIWLICIHMRHLHMSSVSNSNVQLLYHYSYIYIDFFPIFLSRCFQTCLPTRWCSRRASALGAGGRGIDPQQGHTKSFKNGGNGFHSWRSGLRDSITPDRLVSG